MVSSPPTEAGYVKDQDVVAVSFTEVGNNSAESYGQSGYLLSPRQAEILGKQLLNAAEAADDSSECDHDWQSGQMYSDGWTDTCRKCGETREIDR